MIRIPHIVRKSLDTCSRRQEPFLRHILDEQYIVSINHKTLIGLLVVLSRFEGKISITTRYRVLGFEGRGRNVIYFAHA